MSELRNRIKIIALFHEELDSQKASIVKAVLGEPAFCEPFVDLLVQSPKNSDPRFYAPTPPTTASKAASQSESSVHFSTSPPLVPPTAPHSPPALDADELEAQELTLGELVVKAVHRILWPGESALNGDNAVNVVNESVTTIAELVVLKKNILNPHNMLRHEA
ncbi:unnamed protein product [Dibothriocephalus latus]|uniref:Uncharacterized protein n=1 Tax=Dibothriocephalus latus TaxID=60516 RepID=A0A3P7LXF9_DIBLA|nr:unnamed protein product [Dibothriocephalus latus]